MRATTTRIILKRALLASGSAAAMALGGAAMAQDDEIIVTAQKRAESIQDVPLAITAYGGEFIRDVNLDDVKDLVTFTPGVTGNTFDSFIDYINVRGISTNDFGVGGDPSVPFFKNGLYQGRNGAVVTTLYDIERAEVLRGPQGFLFGRNAIGGAFNIITARPKLDAFGGYAEIDVGEEGRVVGEAALNIPLSEKFGIRLSGYAGKEDGYVDNLSYPGADPLIGFRKGAGRISALYEDGDFDALLTVEIEKRNQSGSVYRATELGDSWNNLVSLFGVSMRGDGRDIDSDLGLGEDDDADIFSAGLEINIPVGSLTLTSLTGYKKHSYIYAEDFDGTPLNINDYAQDQDGEYFEQELRLVSGDEGPFSWYAGASFYDENIDALFSQHGNEDVMCNFYLNYYGFSNCSDYFAYYGYVFTPSPEGLLEQNRVRGRYHGWAAYIDTTYKFSEQFDVGVGLRYSDDTKNFGIWGLPVSSQLGPYFALGFTSTDYLTDKQSWDAFTPRFITRWRPSDEWMVFASATRGFKSGGFGSFTIAESALAFCGPFSTSCLNLNPGDATPNTFEPEKAWSYEIGTKGNLGGLKLDANVYYYTYKDLQVIVPGVGGGILVDNVGKVTGWGVEGSATAPLGPNFDLMLSAAWADSEVSDAQALCDGTLACEGQPQPTVPKFSGSAILRFTAPLGPGELKAAAELFGQTDTYGGLLRLPEAQNDGYAELALRLGYQANAGWSVTGYVENLTNVLYYSGAAEGGDILPAHYFGPSRPRTFGVRMTYDFGG